MKFFYNFLVLITFVASGVARAQVSEIKLTPSDSRSANLFGTSVAIDGDYILVGAPGAGLGAVYVFKHTGTGWMQEAKLIASDAALSEDHDDFGSSVLLQGDQAFIGAAQSVFVSFLPPEKGAVYYFMRTANGWKEQQKITLPNPRPGEYFGYSMFLSGNRLLIGANEITSSSGGKGAAYIFEFENNTWTMKFKLTASDAADLQYFGESVWLSGDMAVVGAPGCCMINGSAYVFQNENGVWHEKAKLLPANPMDADEFGGVVAAANDFVIIGSRGWARQRGKAYVFQQNAGGWSQVAELDRDASESNQGDLFGQAAAISPDYVLIGASHRNKSPGKEEPGVAYLYKRSNTGWTQYAKLMASDGSNGNNFGWSVAISDRYAVIGAPALPPVSHAPGAVYVYDLSTIVGIQESPETVPATFRLEQNYPNPFNPTTVIRYRIPAADHVELTIFNRLGEPVRTLVSERKAAGSYEIVWDGTDETGRRVASGVYLFRLSVGEQVQTKKMILMR